MATSDEKQDEVERLLGTQREGSVAPKPPGAFTRFFEQETVHQQTPAGGSGIEPGPIDSYAPASARGNLNNVNEDALPIETGATTEQAHLDVLDGMAAQPGAWNDAAISPTNSLMQSETFERLFHNENTMKPAQASTSDFRQPFSGAGFLPLASDRITSGPNSANEFAEMPNDSLGTGPIPLAEPHPRQDSQKATHLFSSLTTPLAGPVVPLQGPSPYTRVIDSSAQRAADQEKANLSAPPASVAPPQAPAPASAPVPVVAPQWPNPQLYHLPYPPQASIPQQAISPQPSIASHAAGVLPAAQPPIQAAEQTPQPGWIAYMPLIIGLNVLLFLTAIFVLIFALLSK